MKYNFEQASRHGHDPDSKVYQSIRKILLDFYKRGLLERFDGECIAAADILQHSLASEGITSRIVECQLSIVNVDPKKGVIWNFVGFDNNLASYGIDTHAVVVTETENPYLIDLSVARTIEGNRPWIIEPLNTEDTLILGKFQIDDFNCTYHPKINPRLVGLHQKTLLDRLRNDQKIERNLKLLRFMVFVLIAIAVANFTRGAYDFYQTFIVDSNDWGPAKEKD